MVYEGADGIYASGLLVPRFERAGAKLKCNLKITVTTDSKHSR